MTDRVHRRLIQDRQVLAVFFADAVAVGVNPACRFQQCLCALDVLRQATCVVGCVKGGGRDDVTRRCAACAVAHFGQGLTINCHRKRFTHVDVGQEGVGVLDGCAFAFGQISRRIGHVHFQTLDKSAEGHNEHAFALCRHGCLAVGGDLGVPGIVKLAGRHHSAGRTFGIAAALDHSRSKCRLCRIAVVGIGFHRHRVIDGKASHLERPRAKRHRVRVGAGWCSSAHASRELRLLQDRRGRADKSSERVGLGRVEGDLHGRIIDSFDRFDAFEFRQLGAAASRIHAILAGKDHIRRRYRRTIAPQQAGQQFPGDRCQIFGNPAIFNAGNFADQFGDQCACVIIARQRFNYH